MNPRLLAANLLYRLGAVILTVASELEKPYICERCLMRDCMCRAARGNGRTTRMRGPA